MNLFGILHKLTCHTDSKCNIWSSMRKIYKLSYQPLIQFFVHSWIFLYITQFVIWSIGIDAGLQGNFLVSLKRPVTYFCCEMRISLEWATSIPKNILVYQVLLSQTPWLRHLFKASFFFWSLPVAIISSTYTKRTVTRPESECLEKNVWPPHSCQKRKAH